MGAEGRGSVYMPYGIEPTCEAPSKVNSLVVENGMTSATSATGGDQLSYHIHIAALLTAQDRLR